MRTGPTSRSMAVSLLIAAGLCIGPGADAQGVPGGQVVPMLPTPAPNLPPPVSLAQPAFFVETNGQPEGPLAMKELRARAADGRLTRASLVWRQGMPEWQRAGDVAELRELFAATPPPVPSTQRFGQFMVGTWEVRSMMGEVVVQTIIRYAPDGTFNGAQRMSQPSANLPPVDMPLAGTWEARSLGEARLILTLHFQGEYSPQSAVFTVVDQRQLRNEGTGATATRVE